MNRGLTWKRWWVRAAVALTISAPVAQTQSLHPGPLRQGATDGKGSAARVSGEILTTTFNGQELSYEVIDGFAVHDGDMVLGEAKAIASVRPLGKSGRALGQFGIRRRNANNGGARLWPDGVVPYVIDSSIPSTQSEQIRRAVAEWSDRTVIRLTERTSQADYVRIVAGSGCIAQVGRAGGAQTIGLAPTCSYSAIVHEIGHAVGLGHEHQRRDRNDFIMLAVDLRTVTHNQSYTTTLGVIQGPYDYRSVMHYDPFIATDTGGIIRVFETIPPGMPIAGQRHKEEGAALSAGDIDAVSRLYGATPQATTIQTNPAGLEIVVDGVRVTTPVTFNWLSGSTHVLEAPLWQTHETNQQALGNESARPLEHRYVFGRWTRNRDRIHTFTADPDTTWIEASFIEQVRSSSSGNFDTEVLDGGSPSGYLDQFIDFNATPRALAFVSSPATDPAFQVIQLTNLGSGSETYSIASDQPWLSASPSETRLAVGESVEIEVRALRTGMAPEIHSGDLTITPASQQGTDLPSIPISFVVLPEPVSVPLGSSGESAEIVVSATEGLLSAGGRRLADGNRVNAANGDIYDLTTDANGVVVATFVPRTQSLTLSQGVDVLLTQDRAGDEGWRIGAERVTNGYRYVHGENEFVLELLKGRWRLARYLIRTVAGNSELADGIPAVDASLDSPYGVAVDADGNVYVSETEDHRVRKIDPLGIITTFAGSRSPGYSGDGRAAVQAELLGPSGMALDEAGNTYFAEYYSNVVRKVESSGKITTVAGTGRWRLGYNGDGGLATQAELYRPQGVAVDTASNVYIADSYNHRVRKVDASGTITTLAGTGTQGYSGDGGPATQAQLYRPQGVAVDGASNVYIADSYNNRVRKVDASGTITTLVGTGAWGSSGDGGPATEAQLRVPYGLALDAFGSVYVADVYSHRVRKVDASGTITTLAGTGTPGYSGDGGLATEAQFHGPQGVAVDAAANIYVIDNGNGRLRKIDSQGIVATLAGSGDSRYPRTGGPVQADSVSLTSPRGAALDSAGNFFFTDTGSLWKLTPEATILAVSPLGGRFSSGVASDAVGNVYVADTSNSRVQKVDTSGTITTLAVTGTPGFSGDGGPATDAQLRYPYGLAADAVGNVYVSDSYNNRVRKVDLSGTITTLAGTGQAGYSGDGGPATEAQVDFPSALAVDIAGNVYVAEGSRVRKVIASGTIATLADFNDLGGAPESIAVDESGNVYVGISDYGRGDRIGRIHADDGGVDIIAGSGEPGFRGEGVPSGDARLWVAGIAVDRSGKVWFTDDGNRRVRVLERLP